MSHRNGASNRSIPIATAPPELSTTEVASFPDETELVTVERAVCELIAEAGRIVTDRRGSLLNVKYKGGNKGDPVTEVDRAVEAFLAKAVTERFPDHAVLGEEGQEPSDRHEYEYEWIVDPVDGTLNFVHGLPLYAISIGVLHRRRPVVGAVYLPTSGETLHARRGGGAYRDGAPIHVREGTGSRSGLVAGLPGGYRQGFETDREFRRRLREIRSLGSMALEIGMVATGALDFALFRGPKVWDVAGGVPLVREAGGQVLAYSRRRSGWFPLDLFVAPPAGPRKPRVLRGWGHPVLVGSAQVLESLQQHVTPRYPSPFRSTLWGGYQGAKRGYTAARTIRE